MATKLGPVPLFGIGNAGKSVNVDAQERLNLYVEVQTDAEKSRLTLYPTPGLVRFVNFGSRPCRGLYQKGDYLYAVNGATLWKVDNSGTKTNVGTLLTVSGRVDISDNGTQIIVVDGPNGYIYNTDTDVFVQITDSAWPGGDTVTFLNGYFIVSKPNTGQFYISDPYNGLAWNALDFATAESNPDNLLRLIADNGQLCLFGPVTTEFWGDSGAQDFPFARIGASAIEWGLAARWSLCKFMDSLIFLRRNRLGSVQVCTLSGYAATPVSTPEIDYILSQYSAVEDATGLAYMVSGHPFYQLNFPTVGESWLYDGLSKAWSKLQSGDGRHRGEIQQSYINRTVVSDYENGKLYFVRDDVYTDDGLSIPRELITRHQSIGDWTVFDEIWMEFEAGTGMTPISGPGLDSSPIFIDFDLIDFADFDGTVFADFTDATTPPPAPPNPSTCPRVMMCVSKDSGHTWGNEYWVEMGKQGEYRRRAVWRRLGRARDFVFKFRVTDPVKVVFVAAWGRVGR